MSFAFVGGASRSSGYFVRMIKFCASFQVSQIESLIFGIFGQKMDLFVCKRRIVVIVYWLQTIEIALKRFWYCSRFRKGGSKSSFKFH